MGANSLTVSTRIRVLAAIVRRGRVDNPHELQVEVGIGSHDIVHSLYDLRDAGLIRFRSGKPTQWRDKPGRGSVTKTVPTRIVPTIAGVNLIRREL